MQGQGEEVKQDIERLGNREVANMVKKKMPKSTRSKNRSMFKFGKRTKKAAPISIKEDLEGAKMRAAPNSAKASDLK